MQVGDGDAVFAFDLFQFGLRLIQLAAGHDTRLEQGFRPLVLAFGQLELRVQGRHGDLGADQACLLGFQFGRGFLVDQALLRQGACLFRAQAGDLGFQFAGFQR